MPGSRSALSMNAALALTVLLSTGLQAIGGDILHYGRKVASSREAVVGTGVRWNKACQSTGVPQVWLDIAPEHGFVCIRIGTVRPRNIFFGGSDQCLKTPMDGAQVIYRSRSGFTGIDSIGYTLKFPKGDRRLAVAISVMPNTGPAMPQDSPALFERQTSGPVPECAALVS
jgi:hypothetical protein